MSQKNLPKQKNTFKELEKKITPVFVMNNSTLKPYAKLFEYYPENIYQKPLGSLVGFFEVKEYSEDSAYIVNFLTSVLKKEYYINPKRPVSESFDSALQKVNIALSEIVKHGNINWLGNLDGAICVMEKNNIHFSVTGKSHIFIKRKEQFSDISEGLAPESSNPHPLKTFVDVSSGHLENGDKILIFSDDIFQVLPVLQLKKSAMRFDQDKFIQFIKTALSNELEMTSMIIVDAQIANEEKNDGLSVITDEDNSSQNEVSEFNAFSQETYSQKKKLKKVEIIEEEIKNKEYTDKKTGHIYVQGEENQQIKETQASLVMVMAKEKIADLTFQTKNEIRKKFISVKKRIAKLQETRRLKKIETDKIKKEEDEMLSYNKSIAQAEKEAAILEELEKEKQEKIAIEKEAAAIILNENKQENIVEKQTPTEKTISLSEKIRLAKQELLNEKGSAVKESEEELSSHSLSLQEKINKARKEVTDRFDSAIKSREEKKGQKEAFVLKDQTPDENTLNTSLFFISKNYKSLLSKLEEGDYKNKILIFIKKISSKTKFLLSKISRYSTKQKSIIALVCFLIISIPIFFLTSKATPKPQPKVETTPQVPTLQESLSGEKNIILNPAIEKNSLASDTVSILTYENIPYAITKQKIITTKNGMAKEYPIPTEYGQAVYSSFMNDLSLILILTDQKKIISFSPVSQQFKDNLINLPADSNPKFMATYLTYLYIPDYTANQIYRFPRADGGFGEKINWLKTEEKLPNIYSMAIDDSVYFTDTSGASVSKFFKGTKQDISFENSKTPISFDLVYTSTESSFIYILDKKNYRIIQYNKTGEIIRQYFLGQDSKNISSFTIDSHDQKAYITSEKDLISVSL
jgi:hypothetical protein